VISKPQTLFCVNHWLIAFYLPFLFNLFNVPKDLMSIYHYFFVLVLYMKHELCNQFQKFVCLISKSYEHMLKWWKINKAQFHVVGYLDWQILGYCRESNWIEWIFSIALGFNRTPHMINLEFFYFESKCIDFQELIEWFALRLWMIYTEIFWKLWGHQGKICWANGKGIWKPTTQVCWVWQFSKKLIDVIWRILLNLIASNVLYNHKHV
jgi:hypothetical protein